MARSNDGVDFLWIFIVGFFVIVPLFKGAISKLPGGKNDTTKIVNLQENTPQESEGVKEETPIAQEESFSTGGFTEIVIENNSATAVKGQKAKFKVAGNVVKVLIETPDKEEIRGRVKGGMAYATFEEEGNYGVTTYDKNGLSVRWFKVGVQ